MSTSHTKSRQRVLIVDNHPLIRRGLTELIEAESDLAVCAAADTFGSAIDAIETKKPDMVITEMALETEDDGLRLLRHIRANWAELPVLILTKHSLPGHAEIALEAGATGYVAKTEKTETLVAAIRHVMAGEPFITSDACGGYDLH